MPGRQHLRGGQVTTYQRRRQGWQGGCSGAGTVARVLNGLRQRLQYRVGSGPAHQPTSTAPSNAAPRSHAASYGLAKAIYAGLWVGSNFLRPIRLTLALAAAPLFDGAITAVSKRTGLPKVGLVQGHGTNAGAWE